MEGITVKSNKNIFIFSGAVFSLFPYIKQLIGTIAYIVDGDMLDLQNYILSFAVNMVFFAFVILLAVLQIQRNRKGIRNRLLPVIGILISALYLLFQVLTAGTLLPQYIILSRLGLVHTIYVMYFKNWLFLGVLGHILLIVGYCKSLIRKK